MSNVLEVRIDRKTYVAAHTGEARPVISDLRFTVGEGEALCIVGPSGCGKTTLLNIISGLDTAFEGHVRIASGASEAALGYMFQTPRLMPWLTVRENVRLALKHSGRGAGPAEALLREMGLGAHLDAYPSQLSGGMQRRVALARAFVGEPRLMLLDEPFLSLDQPAAERLRQQLLELWQRRPTTILFVTHDFREALYIADRILFLSRSPARLVLDQPVTLVRPRDPEGAEIETLRRDLLRRHPDLLAGLTGIRSEGVDAGSNGAAGRENNGGGHVE